MAAVTANQYLPLIDTTRDSALWTPQAVLPTPGSKRALYATGRLVGHIYVVGQPITLGYRYLRGDGAWDTLLAKPDAAVAAGAVQVVSWLFSDYAQDFMIHMQAGATPPTNVYIDLAILWDRDSGT